MYAGVKGKGRYCCNYNNAYRGFAGQVWGRGGARGKARNVGLRTLQIRYFRAVKLGALWQNCIHDTANRQGPLANAISDLSHDQYSLLGAGGRVHPPVIPGSSTAACRLADLEDEGEDVAPDGVRSIFGTFSRDRHRVRRDQ